MNQIFGHKKIRAELQSQIVSSKLPHSLLLVGEDGIGKKMVALEVAKTLICEKLCACGECQACKYFDLKTLPEFYLLEGSETNAESIRILLSNLSTTAIISNNRVIIINDAHLLHPTSSNILLKSLEEPRPNIFFILISSSPSKMLRTVVSRCQIFSFGLLSLSEQKQALHFLSAEQKDSLRKLNLPNSTPPGRVAKFLEIRQMLQPLPEAVDELLNGNEHVAIKIAGDLSKLGRDLAKEVISYLVLFSRDKLVASKKHKKQLSQFIENLLVADFMISERNLNPGLVWINLMLSLCNEQADYKMIDTVGL